MVVKNTTNKLRTAAKKLKSKTEEKAEKLLTSIQNRLETILADIGKYQQMREQEMSYEEIALRRARERYGI